MTQKYIVLAEYVNLNGITTSQKENYQTYRTGDGNDHKVLLSDYMLERGQVFEVDLAILDILQLKNLCSKEGSLALVRIGTEYNAVGKKLGHIVDFYKTKIGVDNKFTNSTMNDVIISKFCQNWEEQKAYILNQQYSRWYLPIIDQFYLKQIKTNSKK